MLGTGKSWTRQRAPGGVGGPPFKIRQFDVVAHKLV